MEPGRVARYLRCWAALGAAADEAGVRAWLFRSAEEPETYLEFLESADAAAFEAPALEAARRSLDEEIGTGTVEEWVETRTDGGAE